MTVDERRAAPGPGGVVVATKLHIPAARRHQVPRSRLIERLAAADSARRLVLVSAPPGAGKTTLLAEWHASGADRRGFAWLSLDRGDNDPVRFWSCVIAAIRTVEPGFGAEAEATLQAPGTSLTGAVVPLIVNELHARPEPVILVLDDYHVIAADGIHRSLALLVDHLPDGTVVAIASRTDPPLPLARLRVRHELGELRATDLGFDADEAAVLLNERHHLALDRGQVERLTTRTEGWAAGLQLAALSLQDRADRAEFIDMFAGDDRQVMDYLAYEVLDGLDAEMRTFLLRTSILDRLSGPLCDTVTGGGGSSERLEELLRSGLFTVALDDRQDWYRYHHLFADLLRHELRRSEPELVPGLHSAASRWLREHGLVEEAIGHALAAADPAEAAELVATHWSTFFNRGCLATVSAWLDALPEEAVAADSRLWLAKVWTALDGGQLDELDSLFTQDVTAGGEAWKGLLQALHSFKRGNVAGARRAVDDLDEGDGSEFWNTVASCLAGVCDYWLDEPAGARAALERAEALARRDGNDLAAVYALGYLALLHADARDWPAAEQRLEAIAAIERGEPRVREHFVAMVPRLAEGRLHDNAARVAEAATAFERSAELARRGAGLPERLCVLLRLADARRRGDDLDGARALAQEARATLDDLADPVPFEPLVAAAERRLHLAQVRTERPGATSGDALSGRELAVLKLLPTGLSQREIGDELFVSLNTVKTHLRSIYRKLDAPTRERAVERARELGLV